MQRLGLGINEIDVKLGEAFVVSLNSVPTAGFTWKIVRGLDSLCLVAHNRATITQLVGSATVEEFEFRAESIGSVVLELICSRAWEETIAATYRVRVNISD
jgi:predicted secreted protein